MTEFNHTNEAFLKDLAEGYTGNAAKAREIAGEAAADSDPVRKTRLLSVMYIQQRDRDLFETVREPQENVQELQEIKDLQKDLTELDHEERIVSLMKTYEHLDNAAIAEELGISEDHVRALLQSANTLVKKQEEGVIAENLPLPPQPKPKEKEGFRLSLKAVIGIAAAVVLIVGVFISVRSYSSSQFAKGETLMESGDYEGAVKAFRTAAAWGEGDQAVLRMGDACLMAGDDVNAYTFYEDYHEKYRDDEYSAGQMVICLKKQADRYLQSGNTAKATDALMRAQTLQPSVYTEYRLQAIEGDGTYQSEDGRVWNTYGQLVKAACLNERGTVLYTVEMVYDEASHWQKMTAGKSGTLRTSQFSDFRYGDGTVYDVRWIPGGDLPAIQTVSYSDQREDAVYEYDEEGNVTAMTVEHDAGDASAFADYSRIVFVRNEYGETTDAEVYDRSDRKIGNGIHVPGSGWLYMFTVSR